MSVNTRVADQVSETPDRTVTELEVYKPQEQEVCDLETQITLGERAWGQINLGESARGQITLEKGARGQITCCRDLRNQAAGDSETVGP